MGISLLATVVASAQELPKADDRGLKSPSTSSHKKEGAPEANGPIDVLTDTKGFNPHSYLNEKVLPEIRRRWYNLVPEVARPPILRKGHVTLMFKLLRDGKVTDIRLVGSSGDVSLDRAAFGGVAGASPLPPLPVDYQCQDLTLRFHFYYNPSPGEIDKTKDSDENGLIPCVTTRIRTDDVFELLVSPETATVIIGRVQQFSADLAGTTTPAVKWSLQGAGCDGSACGTISADGLYTAPAKLPHPAMVTVIARSELHPDTAGSATITLLSAIPNQ